MFQLAKKTLDFLWKQKKFLVLIFILTFFLFALRFPWSDLFEKTVKNFQKKSPPFLQTDFHELHLKLFPPGVEFENFSLNYKRKVLQLDSFRVSMILSKWLALKKAWKFRAVKENSSLSIEFWEKGKIVEEGSEESPLSVYFVRGYSPFWELEFLNSLFPNVKMSGGINARFDYEGHPDRIQEAQASLSLKGNGIRLSQVELNTPLGSLNLPPIQWKEGEIVSRLREGELVFKTFRLGSPSDDFIVQIKGSGSVLYSYGKVRLNSYDIQLQMDVDKTFPMNLLDLMFAGYKEDKGSFFRYRLRLIGQGQQVPNMEKLLEF